MNPPTVSHITPVSPGLAALRCYAGLRRMGVSFPVAMAISKAYLPSPRPALVRGSAHMGRLSSITCNPRA